MNRTLMFAAGLCFAVTVAFLSAPDTAQAADEIELSNCHVPNKGDDGPDYFECWCMFNKTTKQTRAICNEGGGCWTDTGWEGGTPPRVIGDPLPVSYNGAGDMLVSVAPGLGGYFSSTSNPACLAFTSNTSGVVIFPAALLH